MREITTVQLLDRLEAGDVTLVDVREPREYAEGCVPGAVNIPMGRLPGRVHELDPARPVALICWSGNRSGAMVPLVEAGGRRAMNVVGGTKAWLEAGRPVQAVAR